ncbi:hypothetical protein E2C01_015994 [Portunus trituberculatus]|uniref:Uncharacterized protein n=1 Tax=Portunus trituberculatus TaxID=210409 RepID=A0A5B7DMX4_PORTR|nr:hypothetical protein [Portunus trituberculatus]
MSDKRRDTDAPLLSRSSETTELRRRAEAILRRKTMSQSRDDTTRHNTTRHDTTQHDTTRHQQQDGQSFMGQSSYMLILFGQQGSTQY